MNHYAKNVIAIGMERQIVVLRPARPLNQLRRSSVPTPTPSTWQVGGDNAMTWQAHDFNPPAGGSSQQGHQIMIEVRVVLPLQVAALIRAMHAPRTRLASLGNCAARTRGCSV